MFSRLEFLIVVVSLLYNSICFEEIKANSHPRSLLSQVRRQSINKPRLWVQTPTLPPFGNISRGGAYGSHATYTLPAQALRVVAGPAVGALALCAKNASDP